MKLRYFGIALIFSTLIYASCTKEDDSEVVSQIFELDLFTGIDLSISGNVTLVPGVTQQVEISGPMFTVNEIIKTVNNGFWDISLPSNFNRSYKDLEITITSNAIENITLSGSGNIVSEHILPITSIVLSGSGNMNIKAESSSLNCNISGSGNITAAGVVDELNQEISGSGNFEGFNLMSRDGNITVSGSGNSEVFVTTNLDVTISGSGNISYKGQPTITQNISGSGNLIDAN